jgi:hypothetical protein
LQLQADRYSWLWIRPPNDPDEYLKLVGQADAHQLLKVDPGALDAA